MTTTKEFRRLLSDTDPSSYLEACDVEEAFSIMRAGLPELLRVVEAVAKMNPKGTPVSNGVGWVCKLCPASIYDSVSTDAHAPGCPWVLAHKLAGEK